MFFNLTAFLPLGKVSRHIPRPVAGYKNLFLLIFILSCSAPDPRAKGGGEDPGGGGRGEDVPGAGQIPSHQVELLPTAGAPSPRRGVLTLRVWGGAAAFIGGHDDSTDFGDLSIYDTRSGSWSRAALPNNLRGRFLAAGASLGSSAGDLSGLFVWGGARYGDVTKKRGERLADGAFWGGSSLPAELPGVGAGAPAERSGHCAVAFTSGGLGYFFVWGGESGGRPLDDGAIYSAVSNSWARVGGGEGTPLGREGHRCWWWEERRLVVVHGGSTGDGPVADTWTYDPAGGLWAQVRYVGTHPTPRLDPCAAFDGEGRILVWGGSKPQLSRDGYTADLGTGEALNLQPKENTAEWPGTCDGREAGSPAAYAKKAGFVIPTVEPSPDGTRRRTMWRIQFPRRGEGPEMKSLSLGGDGGGPLIDHRAVGTEAVAVDDERVVLWGGGDPDAVGDANNSGVLVRFEK